jgi:glycosyltransferase involved in cell wall biosynthesis
MRDDMQAATPPRQPLISLKTPTGSPALRPSGPPAVRSSGPRTLEPSDPLPERPIKVLIVCDHIGYGHALHGAGRMMVEMTMGFDPRRVQVTSCVLRDAGELGQRLNAEGVPLQFWNAHRFSLAPLIKIMKLVREKNIDVIHVTDFQADTLGRLAGLFTRRPVIVHVRTHHSKYQKRPYPWYMEAVNRFLAVDTALAIANSDSLRGFALKRMGFKPEQVVTVHNPVSTYTMKPVNGEDVARLRREYRLDSAWPIIGAVTRFYPAKGIGYLVAAFPAVLARFPDARLVLVGEGPLGDDLKAQAAELGIADKVIFTGFRPDAEAHVQLFTISAVPSLEEGIGNVAIESIVGGVPVVASREGGLPEVVVAEKSGLLVRPGDSTALAAALLRILEEPFLLDQLRRGCLEEAGRFSLATYTERLEQLYRQCVS